MPRNQSFALDIGWHALLKDVGIRTDHVRGMLDRTALQIDLGSTGLID